MSAGKDKKVADLLKIPLKFKCCLCHTNVFGSLHTFRNHVKNVHSLEQTAPEFSFDIVTHEGQDYFAVDHFLIKVTELIKDMCPYKCGDRVKKADEFQHILEKHEDFCPTCRETVDAGKAGIHVRSTVHKTSTILRCPSCRFSSENIDTFWKHRLQKHKGDLKNVPEFEAPEEPVQQKTITDSGLACPYCPFKHEDQLKLKVHVHSKHDPDCPHCLNSKEPIGLHIRTRHPLAKLMLCQDCEYSSANQEAFWQHRLTSHAVMDDDSEKELEESKSCLFCEETFESLEELFYHVHETHDPCCPQCNYVDRGRGIDHHMTMASHDWSDLSKTQCSSWGCKKNFASLQEFWQHRKTLHMHIMENGKKVTTDITEIIGQVKRKKSQITKPAKRAKRDDPLPVSRKVGTLSPKEDFEELLDHQLEQVQCVDQVQPMDAITDNSIIESIDQEKITVTPLDQVLEKVEAQVPDSIEGKAEEATTKEISNYKCLVM